MIQIQDVTLHLFTQHPGGGETPPMMAYKGRLCPKGVPFTGFKNMKG